MKKDDNIRKFILDGNEFVIDMRFEYLVDLIENKKFAKEVSSIEADFILDFKSCIKKVLKRIELGVDEDIPYAFFLSMTLMSSCIISKNYNHKLKAKKFISKVYSENKNNFIAKVAYADSFALDRDPKKVAQVFDFNFDLKNMYENNSPIPLCIAIYYLRLAQDYYQIIGDMKSAKKYHEYLNKIGSKPFLIEDINLQSEFFADFN